MSEADKQEAKELSRRAASQAKHASKNTARAVKAVAEPMVEEAADRVEDATEVVVQKTKTVSPRALAALSGHTGQGFMALSVCIWAGSIAFNKFGTAYASRTRVMRVPNTNTNGPA